MNKLDGEYNIEHKIGVHAKKEHDYRYNIHWKGDSKRTSASNESHGESKQFLQHPFGAEFA